MTTPEYAIAPDREWSVAAGFWEGVDAEQLRFPRCTTCGRFVWYPLPRCPTCRTESLAWTVVDPEGEIYSHTVVHRKYLPALEKALPLTIILAQFGDAPGVRLVTGLADSDQAHGVAIGKHLRMVFPIVEHGQRMPLATLES